MVAVALARTLEFDVINTTTRKSRAAATPTRRPRGPNTPSTPPTSSAAF